jgi:hypothetical protein
MASTHLGHKCFEGICTAGRHGDIAAGGYHGLRYGGTDSR